MANINSIIENYVGKDIFPILSILLVANEQSYRPTVSEITNLFYVKPPAQQNIFFSHTNIAAAYLQTPSKEKDEQELIDYLKKVGWITVAEDNRISITNFGKSIIQGMPKQSEEDDSSFSTIFKSDDPLVYGKLHQALSNENHELLVDPYFKFDYLPFFQTTHIRKFILLDKQRNEPNKEIEKIQFGLWGLQEDGQNDYEFRCASSAKMHDRFLKDVDGKVYSIGTSINGIGKRTSMMIKIPQCIQEEALNYIDNLWQSAETIEPKAPNQK